MSFLAAFALLVFPFFAPTVVVGPGTVVVEAGDMGLGGVPAPPSVAPPVAPLPESRASVSAPAAPASGVLLSDDEPGAPAAILVASREAFEAVKAARRAPTVAGVCAALMAGIILLVALARRFGNLLLTSNQVRLFTVFATAAIGGLAGVTPSATWLEAVLVSASPVLAVGFHQTFLKSRVRG